MTAAAFDAEAFAMRTIEKDILDDRQEEWLMRRIELLEVALVDRRVRRQLRREIRAGQRNFAHVSPDPADVRAEAAFNAYLSGGAS